MAPRQTGQIHAPAAALYAGFGFSGVGVEGGVGGTGVGRRLLLRLRL